MPKQRRTRPKPEPAEHEHVFTEAVDVAVDMHGVYVERVSWPCSVKDCREFGMCLTTNGRYVSAAYRLRKVEAA